MTDEDLTLVSDCCEIPDCHDTMDRDGWGICPRCKEHAYFATIAEHVRNVAAAHDQLARRSTA